MSIFKLHIPDISCAACAESIKNALDGCRGVESVEINILSKTVTITVSEKETTLDSNIKQILYDTVDAIGFPATDELVNQVEIDPLTQKKYISAKKNIRNYWIKGFIGVLAGAAMMAICLFWMGIPFLVISILSGISSLLTLFLGKDTYKQAATQLVKAKTLSMESLFTVSTLVALGVSCASFFIPWLPMMFDAALFILGFKNIGTAIKESAKQRVAKMSCRDYAPKEIEVEGSENKFQRYLVKDLLPGNIIIVRSGQTVPTNAICLSEDVSLYKTRITGDTIPKTIAVGETIQAGCVVPQDVSFIKMKVIAKESDSYLARLDQELEQAELQKAPIEISTNKMLKYFIRSVFAIAIISSIVVGVMFSPIAAIQCGISILASACPCTLGLIIPFAIKIGIAKAAEHGVNFKSGKSIQAAAEIDTVVFDLNGTLTTGIPTVINSTVPPEMLAHLAAMEKNLNHPFAKAIFNYANEKSTESKDGAEFKDFTLDKSYHAGVTAKIDNEDFAVGNSRLMQKLGIDISQCNEEVKSTNADVIYFVRNKIIIGTILLRTPLRNDAKQTIQELKRLGKKIHLCTGSDANIAIKYADELGIPQENIEANCVTKSAYIQALTRKGHKVAMIGDAANDATAVAASHFGIAIKSAASDDVTREHAGATINNASLWPVVNAFTIANQTRSNIRQNLVATVSYNLLAMIVFGGLLVAVGFTLNPALGALLMVAQIGLVLMNLERFKRQPVSSFKSSPEFKSTHGNLASKLTQKPGTQPTIYPANSPSSHFASSTSSSLSRFSISPRQTMSNQRIEGTSKIRP